MKGQFYIISVVIVVVIATAIIMTISQLRPSLGDTIKEDARFIIYTIERNGEEAVRVALVRVSHTNDTSLANNTILNYTLESSDFARRSRTSLRWNYSVQVQQSEITVDYWYTLRGEGVSVNGSFSVHKKLDVKTVAWYSDGVNLNATVTSESGYVCNLTNSNFAILLNDTLTDFNITETGPGRYTGKYNSTLGAGEYNITTNVTDSRNVVAINSTSFTV